MRLWVVIELSQAVYVDTIVLGSYEYYSSTIYEFEIWGSASKLTEESAAGWTLLGNFTTATSATVNGQANNGSVSDGSDGSNGNGNGNGNGQNRHLQRFLIDIGNLENLGSVRYLLIKPLTYHGKGPVCTLSVIRVFGMTPTERVRTVQTLQQAAKKSKTPAGSNGHNGASAHRTQAVPPSSPASGELNGSENLEDGTTAGNSAPQQQGTSSQSLSSEEAADSDIEEATATLGEDALPKTQGPKSDDSEPINGKSPVDEESTANNVDDHNDANGHDSRGGTIAAEDVKGHQANGIHSKDSQPYDGESKPDGKNGAELDHSGTAAGEDQAGNVEPNNIDKEADKEHENQEPETPGPKASHPDRMENTNDADADEPEEAATSQEPGDAQNGHVEDIAADDLILNGEEPHPKLDTVRHSYCLEAFARDFCYYFF